MKSEIKYPFFQESLGQTYQPAYQNIIYGVLKRLHVDYGHPLREDLCQEARLVMADELTRLHENRVPISNQDLGPHLYQKVFWRTIDALRRYQRCREIFVNDGEAGWQTPDPSWQADRHEGHDVLDKLKYQ